MFEYSKRIAFPIENVDSLNKYNPVPHIAKSFQVRSGLCSAVLNVFGYGEAAYFINGKCVPDSYRPTVPCLVTKTVVYNVYDVTEMLVEGTNRLGVMLSADRIFFNQQGEAEQSLCDLAMPSVLIQLDLTYSDGYHQQIASDETFRGARSHIMFHDWTCGEIHDSTKHIIGWCDVDFDDSEWEHVTVIPNFDGDCRTTACPPIRKISETGGEEIAPGLWDFHKTTSGYVRVKVTGYRGSRIKLNYAERLLPGDSHVDRSAAFKYNKPCPDMYNSDEYVLNGSKDQVFDQLFSIHGFRYVEVVGDYDQIELTAITCHTDMVITSSFSCDNQMLNKIHQACVNSVLTCLQGYYVDNPKRDAAWIGDQMLSAETQAVAFDNYEVALENILMCNDNIREDGNLPYHVPTFASHCYNRFIGPDWSGMIFHVPYYVYRYTGKREIVDVAWDAMEKSLEFFATLGTGEGHLLNQKGTGDWSAVKPGCRLECVMSTYYYISAVMMAELAEATGRKSTPYRLLAAEIRNDYRNKYVKNGIVQAEHVTEYILPAWSGILDKEEIPAAVESIVAAIREDNMAFTFGIHGLRMVFDLLSENGEAQLLYDVLVNDKVLGYAHTINLGYDTVPERFDWRIDGIYSLNHHFFSVVDTWFFKWLAGIRVEGFGMAGIRIAPTFVNGVDHVEASMHGICVRYDRDALYVESPYPFKLSLNGKEKDYAAGSYTFSRS